jgi:uncharacterized protein involved in exopolysaccharide biosynthesis
MTPRSPLIGRIAHIGVIDRLWRRSVVFGGLIAIFLTLGFFPERHQAATSLTPTDPDSLGLSGTLGQLGAINNVFGNQAAVEIAMRVGKSIYVRETVIKELNLAKRLEEPNRIKLHRWLEGSVVVRSLRGGIITIEMSSTDPALARDIVGAYGRAMQERLAEINRRRTAYKRDILLSLVSDASRHLIEAQSAYDGFRLKNRYADPRASIAAIGDQVPALDAKIKAKQIQLATARQVFTNQNVTVKQILAELTALRGQLAKIKVGSAQDEDTVGKAVSVSGQLFKLERELAIAKALYDNYLRYLQGTAVEDMTSSANIRILEEPYIETDRQVYLPAMAAALAVFLLWMAIEFYRLRPPVGENFKERETYA